MEKNEIMVNMSVLDNPVQFVAKQTDEEAARMYIFIDMISKQFKPELRKKLLNSAKDFYSWHVNGDVKELRLSRACTRYEDYIETTFDMEKVKQFAYDNHLKLPLKQPEVDMEKLKMCDWFQENVEKFVKKEIKSKKIEPKDTFKVV